MSATGSEPDAQVLKLRFFRPFPNGDKYQSPGSRSAPWVSVNIRPSRFPVN
jgi:hypothetical protein